ncbi:hypothetical protein HCK01_35390, partial [Streptomyces sp. AA8]
MAMTVGELKEWLKSLSPPTPELALPDGLPDALGDLKDAVNLGALSDWFTMGAALTEMVPDPDKLCVTGIIAKETPNLSLWFFSDDEANPDDAPVTGVQIGLSLKQHAVMSVLSALGLQDVLLVYEIRIMDGAAVRELYAQAALAAGGGDPLLITCSLDFAADRTSYEFAVEPEDGREWHVAEAFFGLFGVTPPPVLKDIALHRLVLAYDRGKDSTGFRIEVGAGFPLGDTTADLDVKATLSKSGDSGTYDQEYEGT